jgi:hypothetical protein
MLRAASRAADARRCTELSEGDPMDSRRLPLSIGSLPRDRVRHPGSLLGSGSLDWARGTREVEQTAAVSRYDPGHMSHLL